ncbi:hypothetical protein ONS96_014272 [Cadophora gregata f. sp. sojae]|nr:hypothetical protein ONS96_014272 [Cadophora gregata f. sp. sojae]
MQPFNSTQPIHQCKPSQAKSSKQTNNDPSPLSDAKYSNLQSSKKPPRAALPPQNKILTTNANTAARITGNQKSRKQKRRNMNKPPKIAKPKERTDQTRPEKKTVNKPTQKLTKNHKQFLWAN